MASRGNVLVISFGKKNRKAVKRLKEGEGALIDKVDETIRLARADLGAQATNTTIVPVVLVYKRKAKSRALGTRWRW
jgi:hypothetical protein